MNRNVVKSIMLSVVLAVISVFAVSAQNNSTVEKQVSPEVRFAGSTRDYINFEVSVRQVGNQRLTLRIIDEGGVELYRENIGKGEFTKLVKIARNDYSRLNFVIDSPNSQYKKTFNIKSEYVERLNVEEAN
jgi:hypothetical protein